MFRVIPLTFITSLSVSLVVPAISVTIALSSPTNIFISEDLPAFGLPTITVFIPSDNTFPLSNVVKRLSTLSTRLSTIISNFCGKPSRL